MGEKEDWDEDGDNEWEAKDGWMSSYEFEEYIAEWKWEVQYIFLWIALGNAAKFGWELFYIRDGINYYKNGNLRKQNYNWWELGNQIFLNGVFFTWLVASVTQGLSLFGYMPPEFNFFVWEIGVFWGIGILNLIYGGLSWFSHLRAYLVRENKLKNKTPADIAGATALQADIQREWNAYAIQEITSFFAI